MSARPSTVIVLAKRPVPGRVKTRLTPPFTSDQAAALAAAALTDTLDAIERARPRRRLLAFDGAEDGWLRPGWRLARQPSGDLDVRLVAAFDAVPAAPALLVGMDTPQLTPAHIAAFDHGAADACLGLAVDGGYWAIGFRDPRVARAAVTGVPMSRSDTGSTQLRRLHDLGLRVQLLDVLADVDTAPTARAVADLAPHTGFAATLTALDAVRVA
ncbi:MAG: TIGR04282 family arsenosugar biosynthesis glycosyltransferase [Jatrophihabitans sp.]|uniref:TIGR04282 family arsenosugar biosynthesis glycosyltransferase n=1 Tax=Jatrophihabitans sp. TaxID=1932789 RepID=UPI003F817531